MQTSVKKRVGIIRGGEGKHYASSLNKGGSLISYISENLSDKYKALDILIDKKGAWHINGMPVMPAELIHKVDIIWNTAGPSVSITINNFYIPNVGNGAFSTGLQNSKDILREHMKQIGVSMPRQVVSPKSARQVFEKFTSPWIIRNGNEVRIVQTFDELAELINGQEDLVVEEFIAGKVASVHSVPMFRGEDIYTFPLGNTYGNFSTEEKEKLAILAKDLHTHIGAKHYLKSDFVLNPHGKVYLLQIESSPDLNTDSHLSQVSTSVGAKMDHIIEHILEQAYLWKTQG